MPLMEITGGKNLRVKSQTGDAVSGVGVDMHSPCLLNVAALNQGPLLGIKL